MIKPALILHRKLPSDQMPYLVGYGRGGINTRRKGGIFLSNKLTSNSDKSSIISLQHTAEQMDFYPRVTQKDKYNVPTFKLFPRQKINLNYVRLAGILYSLNFKKVLGQVRIFFKCEADLMYLTLYQSTALVKERTAKKRV